jgi:hypothetical protein
MSFREIYVYEIPEFLRLWVRSEGFHSTGLGRRKDGAALRGGGASGCSMVAERAA